MIQEQLAHLPEFLPDYRPFPPVKEHTAWQGLPLRAKQRFLQAGEAALQTPIAPLPLSLWLDFTHTGRRTPWETAYFSRRARLCGRRGIIALGVVFFVFVGIIKIVQEFFEETFLLW